MSNLVIPDGGNIGSASDTDAIAISSGGNVTLSQTLDGGAIGSAVTMSANQACVKTALNASGSAPIYACRAWVNFDGTSTIAIRASGNVSSITDNGGAGGGDYTVNFTTAMPDNDYTVTGMGRHQNGVSDAGIIIAIQTSDGSTGVTTSSVRISTHSENSSLADSPIVSVAIFR